MLSPVWIAIWTLARAGILAQVGLSRVMTAAAAMASVRPWKLVANCRVPIDSCAVQTRSWLPIAMKGKGRSRGSDVLHV